MKEGQTCDPDEVSELLSHPDDCGSFLQCARYEFLKKSYAKKKKGSKLNRKVFLIKSCPILFKLYFWIRYLVKNRSFNKIGQLFIKEILLRI